MTFLITDLNLCIFCRELGYFLQQYIPPNSPDLTPSDICHFYQHKNRKFKQNHLISDVRGQISKFSSQNSNVAPIQTKKTIKTTFKTWLQRRWRNLWEWLSACCWWRCGWRRGTAWGTREAARCLWRLFWVAPDTWRPALMLERWLTDAPATGLQGFWPGSPRNEFWLVMGGIVAPDALDLVPRD